MAQAREAHLLNSHHATSRAERRTFSGMLRLDMYKIDGLELREQIGE